METVLKPPARQLARASAAQGAYYLVTGLWPIVSMRSFEAVTGPKLENWLVKTVGALVTATATAFLAASRRRPVPSEIRILGVSAAAAFIAIDCIYVAKKRISRIYLLDALAELGLILAWTAPLPLQRVGEAAHKGLSIYLNDHLAGSVAGLALCRHCLAKNPEGELGSFLARLVREIEQDQQSLLKVMDALGVNRRPLKLGVAWLLEKVGRAKTNGPLRGYSPLSRLTELEQLALGVEGKHALWRALETLSTTERRLASFDLSKLIARAERQRSELEHFRLQSVRAALQSPNGRRRLPIVHRRDVPKLRKQQQIIDSFDQPAEDEGPSERGMREQQPGQGRRDGGR
jgi:hypothetical protein